MKQFILILLAVFGNLSAGQENLDVRNPLFTEGSLFTVQLTPGSRQLIVSLAGKPEVKVTPEQIVIFGRIFSKDGSTRNLNIQPSGPSFLLDENLAHGETMEVEIRPKREGGRKQVVKVKAP